MLGILRCPASVAIDLPLIKIDNPKPVPGIINIFGPCGKFLLLPINFNLLFR